LTLDEPKKDETAVQINGVDVLISDEVKGISEGNKIDYVNHFYRKGFIIARTGYGSC
jgi:Fe-S cluster assembly iron-binding protein IscA